MMGVVAGRLRTYMDDMDGWMDDEGASVEMSSVLATLQVVEDFVIDHGMVDAFQDWLDSRLEQECSDGR